MSEMKVEQNAGRDVSSLEGVILDQDGRLVVATARVDPQQETLEILTVQ